MIVSRMMQVVGVAHVNWSLPSMYVLLWGCLWLLFVTLVVDEYVCGGPPLSMIFLGAILRSLAPYGADVRLPKK
ncbi:hypothetical protein L210DRAFT_3570745 [Boletus edulis BED1]|uniref:Uncharacterized protein n=1 Tax=Boletus edulis BED1 TaxID=1328754 RepID=A0AAD4BEM5_BOLED|nr:hypothetical protein L210DRAFT_3570745 [Boletus edulis BED1]